MILRWNWFWTTLELKRTWVAQRFTVKAIAKHQHSDSCFGIESWRIYENVHSLLFDEIFGKIWFGGIFGKILGIHELSSRANVKHFHKLTVDCFERSWREDENCKTRSKLVCKQWHKHMGHSRTKQGPRQLTQIWHWTQFWIESVVWINTKPKYW